MTHSPSALLAATTGAFVSWMLLADCGKSKLAPPAAPLTPPVALCTERDPDVACNRADEIEAWLRDPRLKILGSANTPAGRQGAKLFTVALPRGTSQMVFRAKWRPLTSASLTNDPRKELGAYAVGKLFLEPHEYVAPPTTGHCFDLDHYRSLVDKEARPSFEAENVRCVFGILSYWLENVNDTEDAQKAGTWSEDDILDERLFVENRGYGKSVADLNLLTYLIRHGDAHEYQFLLTKDRRTPRAYTVDNSIAFQSIKNPMLFFREDWSKIQVPALPKESIDRLRSVNDDAWASLGVIEQYELVDHRLVPTQPTGTVGPPDSGLRWVGLGLQIGLTDAEIKGVRSRLKSLLEDIEHRDVKTF